MTATSDVEDRGAIISEVLWCLIQETTVNGHSKLVLEPEKDQILNTKTKTKITTSTGSKQRYLVDLTFK